MGGCCSGYTRSFFLFILDCGYMLVFHVQRAKKHMELVTVGWIALEVVKGLTE